MKHQLTKATGVHWRSLMRLALVLALALGLAGRAPSALGQTFKTLYNFPYRSFPSGTLIDVAGTVYGTTTVGGGTGFYGTVFELDSSGVERDLHAFSGVGEGEIPSGGVIAVGNDLYGTTYKGPDSKLGGTVFKVDKTTGEETTLYSFKGGTDGGWVLTGVVADPSGNLYGTTQLGGGIGAGTVYKLNPTTHQKTELYAFNHLLDGKYPQSNLIRDAAGNLYGTTFQGGDLRCAPQGCGTIFEVDPSGNETVLHAFSGEPDGSMPNAALIEDTAGNFYGTTSNGGNSNFGTVFKLDAAGNESVLYRFAGGSFGFWPNAALVRDAAGNLYGTTWEGGTYNSGTLFKLSPAGNLTVLHNFNITVDGCFPSSLVWGASGVLYGITMEGGPLSSGTIFEVTP